MPDKSKNGFIFLNKRGSPTEYNEHGNIVAFDYPVKKKYLWKKGKEGFHKCKVSWHLPNKRGMGRNKGNSHERETATILSLWIYGEPGIIKRTPLSGGWASGKAGDVILDHELERKGYKFPPIYVECRFYKDLLQHNLLTWIADGTPATLTKWIEEVEQKCDGRLPMLVLRGNGTKPWLLVMKRWLTTGTMLELLRKDGGLWFRSEQHGKGILLPLERIGQLGDGEIFMKRWREDGGPSIVRRFAKPVRGSKNKKNKR